MAGVPGFQDFLAKLDKVSASQMSDDVKNKAFKLRMMVFDTANVKKNIKEILQLEYELLFENPYADKSPIILFDSLTNAVHPKKAITESKIYFHQLRPDIIVEELFHYSLYYEFGNAVLKEKHRLENDDIDFFNRKMKVIQHFIVSGILNIITPEYQEKNLEPKRKSRLEAQGATLQDLIYFNGIPSFGEVRNLVKALLQVDSLPDFLEGPRGLIFRYRPPPPSR
nr:hypothetical protein [Candidatus Sigynarchaeota archaeon]